MRPIRFLLVACCALLGCMPSDKKDQQATQKTNQEVLQVPETYVKLKHPEWSKNAVIYQLNTRQFSEEGTFKAAELELPRLKELGVDIIWLMPIHPIGEKNRKGTLGSPYSVKDYFAVNPEFGTLQDLKEFVRKAHDLGMYVILDWVANHTSWDNTLVESHPEWYERDYKGDFRPTPWWDWSDIIDLDYRYPELRAYMTKALKYWVEEADIDGYRCDVAGFVPIDFWNQVRQELDAIKPVFMLAEWESRDLHAQAFDMTYAWSWNEAVQQICRGEKDLNALYIYYSWNESAYPENSMRMTFTSNHDKNAWEGTMFEQFGDGLEAAIALSVVGEGMPLLYNGQEAGNAKRLQFFEKDPIQWQAHPFNALFKDLFGFMKSHKALWHGKWGSRMLKVPNNNEKEIFSFVRQNKQDKVFAVFNFSDKAQSISFAGRLHVDTYKVFGENTSTTITENTSIKLEPWDYKIYYKD